jgi:hypothetical protein
LDFFCHTPRQLDLAAKRTVTMKKGFELRIEHKSAGGKTTVRDIKLSGSSRSADRPVSRRTADCERRNAPSDWIPLSGYFAKALIVVLWRQPRNTGEQPCKV